MSGLGAVFYREAKIRFKNVGWMFWDLFYPIGYLLVFGVGVSYMMPGLVGDVDYKTFFLASVLGMASFGIASNSAWGFFLDRDNGIFYEMLTYPLSRARFLVGKVLFNALLGLMQALITCVLAWWVLGIRVRPDLFPLLVLGMGGGTMGWFFFYTIFALRIRRNDVFNTVNSVFYFVFLFASSMFYPLEPLPFWFRSISLVNPITWQVDFLRFSTIGLGDPGVVWLKAAAFTLFSLVCFGIAVRSLRQHGVRP